jgi:hypothetical protein
VLAREEPGVDEFAGVVDVEDLVVLAIDSRALQNGV